MVLLGEVCRARCPLHTFKDRSDLRLDTASEFEALAFMLSRRPFQADLCVVLEGLIE